MSWRILVMAFTYLSLPALHAAVSFAPDTLTGAVQINGGPACKYILAYEIARNKIYGFTVTTQDDGTRLKARMTGTIDKKNHKLSFRESAADSHNTESECFFAADLTWRIAGDKILLTGPFKGTDERGDPCYDGTIIFVASASNGSAFTAKPHKKQAVADSGLQRPADIGKPRAVSAAEPGDFSWHADNCILDLWDGEVADGDAVTLLLNGRTTLENYRLTREKKRISFPLQRGTNTIALVALNEGQAPPNTSSILLTDEGIAYPLVARLKKGDTAKLVIRKP